MQKSLTLRQIVKFFDIEKAQVLKDLDNMSSRTYHKYCDEPISSYIDNNTHATLNIKHFLIEQLNLTYDQIKYQSMFDIAKQIELQILKERGILNDN